MKIIYPLYYIPKNIQLFIYQAPLKYKPTYLPSILYTKNLVIWYIIFTMQLACYIKPKMIHTPILYNSRGCVIFYNFLYILISL